MKPHTVNYLRQSDLKYVKNDLKFGKNYLKYCDLKRDFRLGGLQFITKDWVILGVPSYSEP